MEPLKQNNFEEEWQRAFENALISPPSDMWDKIEEALERKKRRPFLFFLRPSAIASGVAAALVLVLGGLFFLNRNNVEKPKDLAQNMPKNGQSKESGITKAIPKIEVTIAQIPNSTQRILDDNVLASTQKSTISTNNFSAKNHSKIKNSEYTEKLKSQNSNMDFEKPSLATAETNKAKSNQVESSLSENRTALESKKIITQSVDNQSVSLENNTVLVESSRNIFTDLNALKGKEYSYLGSSLTLNRNKLIFNNEVSEVPIIASNESKFWLGIQSGVSPFDPNMKLGGLNTFALQAADAFAKTSSSPSISIPNTGIMTGQPTGPVAVSQPQNAIKAGVGTNTGFAFGYKITKKWNLESGIRYLRGNSTLQSNTYAFQQNGYINTFFADYLLQNANNNVVATAQSSSNTVVADASQFNNRYEYLMIPMQLGYEIGLTKKIGLNLLAGISTDIFLQNTVANDNTFVQEKSTINSANDIYKPLNISGLGGVRASYLLSKHWQANIGSSYQHSLFSGINSSTALQMRLRMFGVNYGLNYRF